MTTGAAPLPVLTLTAVRRLRVDEQSRGLVRVSAQVLAALAQVAPELEVRLHGFAE